MLGMAAASGTATIAATPHLRSDYPNVDVHELGGMCRDLQARAEAEGIEIRVVPGGEVALSWAIDASDEELTLASYGQRGTDLLVETPTTSSAGLNAALYQVTRRGYRITLAHPERSRDFQVNPAGVTDLMNQGVLIQINADALLGDPRQSRTCKLAQHLCSEGVAHVLASDGHRPDNWRPVTSLAQGVVAAAALVGPDRARWLSEAVPSAVLEGRDLPPAPPIVAPPAKGRLRLWRRGG
jgi:protein-tyrosine phosphatase